MAVESYATSNEAQSNATSNDAVSPANVPAEPAIIQSSAGDDGSYSFSYKTASSSRSESADAQNSVAGKYSIVGDDGINHGISYTAGSETGYIAEGDSLPRGPVVPGAESGIPTGRILPVLSEDEASGLATDIVAPQTSTVSSGVDVSGSGASGEAPVTTKLAVPSEETHTAGATEAAGENHVTDDTVPIKEPHTISVKDDTVPIQDSYRSSVPVDGSYSFSYHTSSSSRSESSDAHNSLTGQYSFISKDGINRNFNYTAGSETGYIVDGDSLPIGPPVPGAESGKPTGQILPVLSEEEANALASDTSHLASQTPLASSSVTDQAPSKLQHARDDTDTNSVQNGSSSDASYFFRYDVGDSARSEIADKDLNIKGNYRFDVPGGKRYTVRYIAGSDIGFVVNVSEESPPSGVIIQSDSTFAPPKEVPATTEDVASSEESNVQSVTSCNDAVPADDNDDTASTEEPDIPDAKVPKPNEESYVSSFPGDGSYSFSYHTSDSSRFESADAYNSVTGQYSFTADDGINRKINYTAGSETGFITEGDSLPVGPSVPGAENGIPTGRIRPILSKEESNTLGSVHNAGYTDPILKSKENPNAVEKANPDRNIAGYYTSVDQNGTEHRIIHIAGQDTNSIPRGYLSPNPKKDAADATTAHSGTLVHSAPSAGESQSNGGGSSSTTSPPEHPKSSPAAPTESLSNGHSSRIVGDVLLHQYDPANRDKYGYAYTAVN
ncbi:serine-rich adhesin for platelets-like [Macrobrachium rosenbergii]|uniref:serine-rich adhesin for platelets-like n=1 Tax=Macrobrachium rosenbergii TaxID=79674 RepID=UPI0034D5450B